LNGDFDPLANAGGLRGSNCCEALILGLLAGFATLGFVLQSFVVKEDLLASRPDEVLPAVNAFDCAVLELRLRLAPLSVLSVCGLSL
jgi:hypothetical protein